MTTCCKRIIKCFKHTKGGFDLEQMPSASPPVQPRFEEPASDVIPNGEISDNSEQKPEEPRERRPGVPVQPQTDKNLDDVEITTVLKDKQTEEVLQKAIMRNEFLRYIFDEDRLQKCVDAMYSKTVNTGEYIIREGEAGLHLYVCIEGSFEVTKGGMIVNKIRAGEAFGELAILYNTKRFASVQALTMAKLYVLDRLVYRKIMVDFVLEEQKANTEFMRRIPIFKGVPETVLENVGNLLKKEFYQTGHQIVRQGDRGDKFFIIKAGTVLITKRTVGSSVEESIGTFEKGSFFGELALLKEDCRQATVTAQAPGVECLTLDRNNFLEHFENLDTLKSITYDRPAAPEPVIKKHREEYNHIAFEDLDILATLGVGGFGRVELVRYKHNKKQTFALKYLKKYDIVLQQQQEHAFNEKMIMFTCDSDFICKLYKTYRDTRYLYFLMEVCLGGDVWTLIQKQKNRCFDEKTSKFFVACVVEAFDYLHKRQIIYRDLKPENLLLDAEGYVKLVDFGFAKILGSAGKTFTFAGTPEYVAPEIILNRGHDKAVDFWALGIFIHELIVGKPPFRGPDHMKTYNMIIRGIDATELSDKISKVAKILIRNLCRAVPSDRLGCKRNGMNDVRRHRWFENFDWEQLRSRKMPAPIKPKIRSNEDPSNFDKYPKDTDIPEEETTGWDDDF